jgi:hypothetical protein
MTDPAQKPTEQAIPTETLYCTFFDSGYLARGKCLIDSLREHGDHSPIWVLAFDEAAQDFVRSLEADNVHLITPADLDKAEPELPALRAARSTMEYYFTCTPLVMRYVMNQRDGSANTVVYLDADLYYFDDPTLAITAMDGYSVGIIPHRYPANLERRLQKYGTYNAGWVAFRSDTNGRACLDWYAARCIEWCSDTPENGRYADQGYLNDFARNFPGVAVLQDHGLDVAPWNTGRHVVTESSDDTVRIDGSYPLVFFHFHGVRRVRSWWVTAQLIYQSPMSKTLRSAVYRPYLAHLDEAERSIAASGFSPRGRIAPRGAGIRGLVGRARKSAVDILTIATGNALKSTTPGD